MEATKNPEYLRDLAAAVEEFKESVETFVSLHVFNDQMARGIAPALFPRDGVDPADIRRVSSLTARAAGRAAGATPLTNVYYMVQGAGRIDPIASWNSMTQPKPVLEPDNVLDACDQIIGRLEGMARKAEAEVPPELGVRAMHPLIWGGGGISLARRPLPRGRGRCRRGAREPGQNLDQPARRVRDERLAAGFLREAAGVR